MTTTLARAWPSSFCLARPDLAVTAEQRLGIVKLQVFLGDAGAFARLTGGEPPAAGTQVEQQGVHCAWMSPTEWLWIGPEPLVAERTAQWAARGGDEALVVDLTHGRAAFMVSGTGARDVLASLCPLDLWHESFPVHAVARSLLGDTGMFLARLPDLDGAPRFRVVVDQTMAAYAERMLAGSR